MVTYCDSLKRLADAAFIEQYYEKLGETLKSGRIANGIYLLLCYVLFYLKASYISKFWFCNKLEDVF